MIITQDDHDYIQRDIEKYPELFTTLRTYNRVLGQPSFGQQPDRHASV